MSDTLVRVENVSKKFCRDLKRSLWYGLTDLGSELLGNEHSGNGELRADEFWAVKDVSFELKRGECLGLIGPNGAGKTTLLRMLNGLIKPDHGRIEMRGRVGALIALGAGFNPVLTGRENIYVNASILGLNRSEIEATLQEIVDFSGVGEFIDAPVQTYSSGMLVRLGFAIATTLDPDILILDEVLAVGDAAFRQRSLHRVSSMLERAAVIFVSHNASEMSRVCSKGLFLEHGMSGFQGGISEALAAYGRASKPEAPKRTSIFAEDIFLDVAAASPVNQVLVFDESLTLDVPYIAQRTFVDCLIVLTLASQGAYILQCHEVMTIASGSGQLRLHVPRLPLGAGEYSLSLTIMEFAGKVQIVTLLDFQQISVVGRTAYGIPNQARLFVTLNG